MFTPKYASQVTPQKSQSPQQSGAGNPLLSFLGGLTNPFVQTGKTIGAAGIEGAKAADFVAGSPVARFLGNQNDYLDKNGNTITNPLLTQQDYQLYNKNPLKAISNQVNNSDQIASWAVPAGGSLKASAALGGLSGGLSSLNGDATPQSIAGGAAGGALTGGAFARTGALVNGLGQNIENAGVEKVMQGLRPNKTQIQAFSKASGGQDIADYIRQNGWTGDFAANNKQHASDLQDAFDHIALNSDQSIPMAQVEQAFAPHVQQLGSSVVPEVQNKSQALQGILDNLKSKYGDNMSVADLTNERRGLDDLLKQNQFGLPAEQATYLRSGRDALHDATVNATKGQASQNGLDLAQLGKELQKAYAFQKIADKQNGLGRGNKFINPFEATTMGVGGLGGLLLAMGMGGPGAIGAGLGTLGSYLAYKGINSKPSIALQSKALQGAGQGLQNIAQKPINPLLYQFLGKSARNAGANTGSNAANFVTTGQ